MHHARRRIGTAVAFGLVAATLIGVPPAIGDDSSTASGYVDDSDSQVAYAGDWRAYTGNADNVAATLHLSLTSTPRPAVTVSWTGGRAQVLASGDNNNQVHGLAEVTLDGQSAETISYSTPEQANRRVVFDTGEIAQGDHTVTIRALDQHGEHGTGIRVGFDALVWGDCLSPNTDVCVPPPLAGDDMTDQAFFSALDLDHPGLENVKAAVAAGDYPAAKLRLAEFYAALPARAPTLPTDSRPAPEPAYDTTIADDILDGVIYSGGKPVGAWNRQRLPHWFEVANAYWWTGESAYAATLGDWLGKLVRSETQATMDSLSVSLGSHPFIHAFWALQDAPYEEFSAAQRIDSLKKMLVNARGLMERLDPSAEPPLAVNIRTIAGNALSQIGMVFPEFAEAGAWRETGWAEAVRAVEEDLFPDGTGVEMATGYSASPLGTALNVLSLAERLGIDPPDFDMDKIEAAGWYWAYLLYPTGAQPMLGDGDATIISEQAAGGGTVYLDGGSITFQDAMPAHYKEIIDNAPPGWYTRGRSRADLVRSAAELTGQPAMAAIVNGGPADLLPEPSRPFTWTAQYFQRSGFDLDSRYLTFDAGPFGTGHSHHDKLSFDLYAYGRPLIADPGRYIYPTVTDPTSTQWRNWFASTAAHNTLMMGDKRQRARPPEVPAQPQTGTTWVSDSTFDEATGVYDKGYNSDNSWKAVHHREMFFVKPDYWIATDRVSGLSASPVTSMFHFTPGTTTVNPTTQAVTFVAEPEADGDTAGVVVAPGGDGWDDVTVAQGVGVPDNPATNPRFAAVRGWYAPVFGSKQEAPQVNYERDGALPFVTSTVLYPFDGAQAPDIQTTTLDVRRADGAPAPGESVAIEVSRPGGRDVFVSAPADGVDRTFTGGATDAARAFVATDGTGVQSFVLLDGTTLTLEGVALIESGQPLTHVSGSFTTDTLAIEGTGLPATFRVAAPDTVIHVTANGEPVAVTRDGDHLVIDTTAEPDPRTICGDRLATITGTDHGDVMVGTNGADVLVGLGGNDVITARGGDDRVCGGTGNDVINGGPGADDISGGAGADVIAVGDGEDRIDHGG